MDSDVVLAPQVEVMAGTETWLAPRSPGGSTPYVYAREAVGAALTADGAAEKADHGDRAARPRRGYSADILAVRGDPTRDAAALTDVQMVMTRGNQHRPTGG